MGLKQAPDVPSWLRGCTYSVNFASPPCHDLVRYAYAPAYSIFSAHGQQVVPLTLSKNKKQLVSLVPADPFNIFNKWATGCPDDYYAKKKKEETVGQQ